MSSAALASACCCSQTCPSSNCPCNSSYAVNGISFTYYFAFTAPQPPGCSCFSGSCYGRSWTIAVSVNQAIPFAVQRVVCSRTGTCGYYGEVVFNVSAVVTLEEYGYCYGTGSALNRTVSQQWSTTTQTTGCLHVTCTNSGGGCSTPYPGGTRKWQHTVEVCDFPIQCTDVEFMGALAGPNGECIPGSDCDWGNTQPEPSMCGPWSLRCIGGKLSYMTPFVCLQSLTSEDYRCLGWYNSRRCAPACTGEILESSILDSNMALLGAFAIKEAPECDPDSEPEEGEDGVCEKRTYAAYGLGMRTLLGDASLQALLTSACGAVNETLYPSAACPDYAVTVQQNGCPANLWTYT